MIKVAIVKPIEKQDVFEEIEIYFDDSEKIYKYLAISTKTGCEVQRSRTIENCIKRVKTYNLYDIVKKMTRFGFVDCPKAIKTEIIYIN